MKIAGAVCADFVTAPCGRPSQLTTPLGQCTILGHTLNRLMKVEGLARRALFVCPRDREVAGAALEAAGLRGVIELVATDTAPRKRRTLLTTGRKWSLESWRGGLVGSTWLDEYIDPQAIAGLLEHCACDALFCVDGHQPVLDPALATAMIAHAQGHESESKLTFAQTPPGLSGAIVRREALADMLQFNVPVGLMLSYRPELAQSDPINKPACYQAPPSVIRTAARLTGDTLRSREILKQAMDELGENVAAAQLCEWLQTPQHSRAAPLPVEIEWELTTADPLPDTQVRPRGPRVPSRELTDLDAVARIARELAQYDDRLVVLGGHGDPLQHPQFLEICRVLRSEDIYGIGVTTPLVDLTDASLEALFANQVDVVEVQLDAHSAATYRTVHGADRFEQVRDNIERLEQARRTRQQPQPLVVPSLTRSAATIGELENFYDHWILKCGSAVLRGHNDYCGALPRDTLLSAMSAIRQPCVRINTRLTLLADGKVALCSQDFAGVITVGNWMTESLRTIWQSGRLAEVREAHVRGDLEALPLCARCTEASRP